MPKKPALSRRNWIQTAAGAAFAATAGAQSGLRIANQPVEIQITRVSPRTVRLSIVPLDEGARPKAIPVDGTLLPAIASAQPTTRLRGPQTVKAGDLKIQFLPNPPAFLIQNAAGETVQNLRLDPATGTLTFDTGKSPLLGLGEGGPQFDRRGAILTPRSGQGAYQLATHGGRVPVPWLVATAGWAMYVHYPYGTFDLTGTEGKFQPPADGALPLDLFFVASREPATIMAEYTRLTGSPELPPLWSLGYQQSHRTLAGRQEVLNEAKLIREKKLPCDALIYLGTGFTPVGWNTNNGEFGFNPMVFPDPKAMFDQLHAEHIRVVLHVAYPVRIPEMSGTVKDPCDRTRRAETQPSCYWDMHRPVFALGVDGWWPDEGDALNLPSRLVRNRFYWEAPQLDRPDERPFALHRNGAAGMQRYASFLWSGDVQSRWETLKNHVPDAINVGISGIPLWGTDIGGFVPTQEYTGELYVRWFQFGAFCTSFRSHGRVWTLHTPWGWNTGAVPPAVSAETPSYKPDPAELHNAQVEPVCRKYLELRYRMMPYLYSAVRESCVTGLPVMRALWLHYPDDPAAVARGDEYLWGRDLLVAPVVEKGATSRQVYLPRGTWYDFWTGERQEGGREISRKVDLETMPLYVRAGAILPMGPVKQYTEEKVDAPLTLQIHPGANGSFLLYDDDGKSFRYRTGEWTGMQMTWSDARRTLGIRLAGGSKMLPSAPRNLSVKLGDATKTAVFEGRNLEVRF